MARTISISTVAFDGYSLEVALGTISREGAIHAEIAFIKGYMDPFTEEMGYLARSDDESRDGRDIHDAARLTGDHMLDFLPGT